MNQMPLFCKLIASAFLSGVGFSLALATEFENGLKLYTSLCVEEASTGYNWKNGKWDRANFSSESKYTVQKLSPEVYRDKSKMHFSCSDKQPEDLGSSGSEKSLRLTYGCYNIRDFGQKLLAFESTMCFEVWQDGQLEAVECGDRKPAFFFLPNGNYIRYPWHANITQNPKNGRKDSLSLGVGKCSVVSQ